MVPEQADRHCPLWHKHLRNRTEGAINPKTLKKQTLKKLQTPISKTTKTQTLKPKTPNSKTAKTQTLKPLRLSKGL